MIRAMTHALVLKPGRDKAVMQGHPWIFSGAVAHASSRWSPGATVQVHTHEGEPIAWAAYSPHSQIRARVWTHDLEHPIDHAFFKRAVSQAIERRRAVAPDADSRGGLRLLHGESDGLPGVTCDAYRDAARGAWLVVQLTSAGADKWRDALCDALIGATGIANVYERSDAEVRTLEGLEPRVGVVHGIEPPDDLVIDEHGMRLHVDIKRGHKTGFYLDQRDNRLRVRELASGARVLNCFGYTGGFSVAALMGGAASVLSIDSSADALALARKNVALNNGDDARAQWSCADAFQTLRDLRAAPQRFDVIVLDPPKLAPSASHVDRAARAYKDINLSAFKLLAPRGRLFTYSCSGAIGQELFQKIVAGAAADARADCVIEARLGAGRDHPQRLAFPEGEYLKGLQLQRVG